MKLTELPSQELQALFLEKYHDKIIVLYFYPKDDTPGCTIEAQQFRDLQSEFNKLNTVILGVSRDNQHSHQKFTQKYDLNFELISDPDEILCQFFDVMQMKNMYGKQVRGVARSTFILKNGEVLETFRNVKADGHANEILTFIKNHYS